jgi:hypothetical protein
MPPANIPQVSGVLPGRAPTVSRRQFLRSTVALATASLVTPTRLRLAGAQVRFTGYPVSLGVASGCPQPESVVLWTRLAPDPLNGGGMEPGRVEVQWELAHDEHFHDGVQPHTHRPRSHSPAGAVPAGRRVVPALRARVFFGLSSYGRGRCGAGRLCGRLHLRVVLGR